MTARTPKVNTENVRRFNDLPNAQQAGMLCNDKQFRRFVALTLKMSPSARANIQPYAAAQFIRARCGVSSRRELNTDDAAAHKFQTLRTEFDAWAGRIPTPR